MALANCATSSDLERLTLDISESVDNCTDIPPARPRSTGGFSCEADDAVDGGSCAEVCAVSGIPRPTLGLIGMADSR
jgi:hypothetical protein